MQIVYRKQFAKHLKQRIKPFPSLYKKFKERVELFVQSPDNPMLQDHQLKGEIIRFRAFSVTGDIRIIYQKEKDYIYFVDIGTHNQVY
ncbi:hypothetical protein A3C26_00630 [Candidatus Daviesbacteria bacterium RIFCSPHIGHO2_02_FULL_39_12]|uniref:Plasmid stabilization protein n=2 Tax=Candidatus Daviesiibacteriota TaxID=1752718 RepID=A0A1F5J9X2_9BACT|nr:MAG: hypothetical protein A3C26_00630 [Candidatus Daviesbacteria bacterium RIFCSPHIGHO2_02_FULL_39_12]OGE72511.1 MAG: hypothetical protein A3H40_00210 [Candidatus Daviesbacteria bacterium RIFCSPLOWO2_02_FULL_38_15]